MSGSNFRRLRRNVDDVQSGLFGEIRATRAGGIDSGLVNACG